MADTLKRPRSPARSGLAGGKLRSDNLKPASVDPKRPLPTARGVLSTAEIEALLRPDLPDPGPPPLAEPRPLEDLEANAGPRLTQDMAERLCARMGLAIHQGTDLALGFDVIETRETQVRTALPAPDTGAAYACFITPEGDVAGVLCLSPQAASTLVEASCGASADALKGARARALTHIDTQLLKRALAPVASLLPGASLDCLETRAAFTLSILPPGLGTCVGLQVKIDSVSAPARLILSNDAVDTLIERLGAPEPQLKSDKTATRKGELAAILTARIASLSVPVSRLANLRPGDTLLLGLPPDEPVQLLSGGRDGLVAAEGEVGRKGNLMAVRVTRRGPALR
ncbi:MAG: FliM/FliN family flagellar motor switch protein [Pseudomonadota bacterium]